MTRNFRQDINGLRFVAVVAVIFFHLDVPGTRGGFLGVDIFFVISGYLITGSILQEANEQNFSFTNFYYRRARRLFPALLTTVAVSLAAGLFLLNPIDLVSLGKSAVYSIFWISNFYFWFDTNYFAAEAYTKPLLHLWSLAVEEQFYLFWPLFIILSHRIGGARAVLISVLSFGAISLIASQVAVRFAPSAAFFLTPFRVFEFAIGGLAVFSEKLKRPRVRIAEIVVIICLISLVLVLTNSDEQTPLPGLNALAVCAATATLIHFGPTHIGRYILANSVANYLGRISYSLYLVHWPLVVFYRYAVFREISWVEKATLFLATLAAGSLMFHIVENRFRYSDYFAASSKKMRLRAFGAVCLTAALASYVWADKGLTWRSGNYFASGYIEEQLVPRRSVEVIKICQTRGWNHCSEVENTTKKKVLVLGDSHGPDGLNMITPALGEEYVVINQLPGCPPIAPSTALAKRISLINRECAALNRTRVDPKYLSNFDVIVISVLWGWYKPEHLQDFLNFAHRANPNVKFIFFGNYIVSNTLCWQIIERLGTKDCFADRFIESKFLYEDELKKVAKLNKALFVSKKDLLCSNGICQLFADKSESIPFTWDKHHLSYEFAHQIGIRIEQHLRNFVYSNPTMHEHSG